MYYCTRQVSGNNKKFSKFLVISTTDNIDTRPNNTKPCLIFRAVKMQDWLSLSGFLLLSLHFIILNLYPPFSFRMSNCRTKVVNNDLLIFTHTHTHTHTHTPSLSHFLSGFFFSLFLILPQPINLFGPSEYPDSSGSWVVPVSMSPVSLAFHAIVMWDWSQR